MPSEFSFSPALLDSLRQASRVCVFTGAGISAESGIATFRQPESGLWSRFDAKALATPEAFARDPALVWGWYEWRRAAMLRARPNPGHRAIAALAQRLPAVSVVTQNVDDLHERAGSADVVHLHGSLATARCFRCRAPWSYPSGIPDMAQAGERLAPPACARCGGPVRPGVVWFGESLPPAAWARAEERITSCDVCLCVGTSSLVYPAAGLPLQAVACGARLVLVNPAATSLDERASWCLHGQAGTVLPALVRALDD